MHSKVYCILSGLSSINIGYWYSKYINSFHKTSLWDLITSKKRRDLSANKKYVDSFVKLWLKGKICAFTWGFLTHELPYIA